MERIFGGAGLNFTHVGGADRAGPGKGAEAIERRPPDTVDGFTGVGFSQDAEADEAAMAGCAGMVDSVLVLGPVEGLTA